MRVTKAREAARRWVMEAWRNLPGFWGAYTAGSTNWLAADAHLAATSDLDVMVVLADPNRASHGGKFTYGGVLLDVSYLGCDRLRSADSVLSDYHLAPSLRTATVLLEPSGHLTELCKSSVQGLRQTIVGLQALRAGEEQSCGESAGGQGGKTASGSDHRLLICGGDQHSHPADSGPEEPDGAHALRGGPSMLAEYGRVDFHEILLELLGCARISRKRVNQHLAAVTSAFDAACGAIKTPFPFASEITENARPIGIDRCMELIERGYHREAMFWIGVTASRCQKVFYHDAPLEMQRRFSQGYDELADDLGVSSFAEIRRRSEAIEMALPRVWGMAEAILAINQDIEDD